ncbi:hypothetical protein CCACVL1_05862 [Corchorus capsularis]|uniref:J domain-containing protein n=1 Tax=Corchorus capsularis TaxID=210143 RepID=A0A1R3JIU7_COCAP|nr:hypothetical protein CCACVL1_05862 [Corchorus capsularis]
MRHKMKPSSSNEPNQNFFKAFQEKREAEKMMTAKKYDEARKHLRKAKELSPNIDNIDSMLTVCDILAASSVMFPGYGIDYYWILQLAPSSTLFVIERRHQKLVSMLQPIMRTFPGAELALQHIQDAYHMLSNNESRSKFDSKRGMGQEECRSFKVQAPSGQSSFSDRETISTAQSSSMDSPRHRLDPSKKLRAEILSVAVGNSVETSTTFEDNEKQFDAVWEKIGAGIGMSLDDGINLSTNSLRPVSEGVATCQDYYNFEDDRKADNLEEGQIWAAHYRAKLQHSYRYAQISINSKPQVCVTWLKPIPVSLGERKWCDKGHPVACGSFELVPEMKEEVSWKTVSSYRCSWTQGITEDQFEMYPKKGEIWAVYKDWDHIHKDWDLDSWSFDAGAMKGCRLELVEIISEFSKYLGADAACLVKVDGFKSVFKRQTMGGNPITFHISPSNMFMFSHIVPAYRFRGGEIDNIAEGMFELDQMALPDYMIQDTDSQQAPKDNGRLVVSKSTPSLNPYPENNILKKRLAAGQVWAVYCGKDEMPRQYIRVNGMNSESRVCGTVLEPMPVLDHEINWQKENLPIACGIFKVSGKSINLDISLFCSLVQCQKSSSCESFYRILPQKGEIWAVYKNWNAKWKRCDYENCQFQIVQVLFVAEDGVKVARLREVNGYLTFFHKLQYEGFDLTYTVPKEDKLSFSHRVPAFRVPGIVKYGIPEDSSHLEPDALPPRRRKYYLHTTLAQLQAVA